MEAYELPELPDYQHSICPGDHIPLFTTVQMKEYARLAVKAERERAIAVVQAEIDRAQALLAIEECGSPLFDRAMTEAGICALRTVMHAFQASADAAIRKGE